MELSNELAKQIEFMSDMLIIAGLFYIAAGLFLGWLIIRIENHLFKIRRILERHDR